MFCALLRPRYQVSVYRTKGTLVLGSTVFFFVLVEDLLPSQQFFSHVATFSWVEPVLSNKDEVSCSGTQHCSPGEIQTRDLAIKSPVLYQLSYNTVLPKLDRCPSMVELVLVYPSNSKLVYFKILHDISDKWQTYYRRMSDFLSL